MNNKLREFTNLVYLSGMTLEAIARKSGIAPHTLKKMHRGQATIPQKLIADLFLVVDNMNQVWGEET